MKQIFQNASPVLPLAFIFYLNFLSRILIAPLLPAIKSELEVSSGQSGMIFLFITCGYFIAITLSGFLSARISHRKAIVFSALSTGCCMILMAFSSTIRGFCLTGFMLGLGAGFYLPSGIATITARYAEKHWGKVIGIHELAPNLGTLTAPFIVAIVAGYLPYRYIFLACAMLVFAAAFIFNRSETGRADIYGTPPVFKHCNRLLRMRAFWMMVILFSLGITAALGLYNMLPLFLVSEHNMSSVEANSLIAISRVATLFTAIAGGWLADRAGACATMGAALLLSGIASAGIGVSDGSSIRIFVMLQPVMAVAFFPAAFKMMSGIRAEGGGDLVVALVVPMAYMIGGGLTPAVMGHAADLGFFRQCFIICGIMITSGVIPVIFLWKAEAGKKRYMRAP